MSETKTTDPAKSTTGELLLILGVAVAVAFGMSLWMRNAAPPSGEPIGGLAVGKTAPAIEAGQWVNGEPDSEPRVTFVHAWFTTCPYCWKHSPELVRLHQSYGDRVRFVGLAVEGADERAEVEDFVAKNGYTWPNGFGAIPTLQGFEAQAFPTAWILDANGRVVWNRDSDESMESALKRALAATVEG